MQAPRNDSPLPSSRSLPPQRLHLFEALGHVAQDRRDPDHLAGFVADRRNGELERDAAAILAQPGNGQDIAFAIAALAGLHDVTIALTVPRTPLLRHDEIDRLPDRLGGGVVEDALRTLVPMADDAVAVG